MVTIDGDPWFVAADVCRALGLDVSRGTLNWTRRLAPDEKRIANRGEHPVLFTGSTAPSAALLAESALYRLIMRAHPDRNPAVHAFQDWVTRVVLPAIRKDGAYIQGEEKFASGEMSEDEFVLKALTILQAKVERLKAENAVMSAELNLVTARGIALGRVPIWPLPQPAASPSPSARP